ncbi:SGNH/GDSL hydrolase family protein [Nesterenkonia sp. Act20]|uniref:SGNH/GDSL hydrolase family protein n=1 Tax=Nesterenkonia sp. Act20 TaxID=1483432 RepID=UPI001C436DFB|nr:SGNH/GDSL hydrolase family protein [Nesterenkonia sp. Act20]
MTHELLTPVPLSPALLRGALELEHTERGALPHRLPGWARAQNTDPQLAMVESQSSGVRIALRTAATTLELETWRTRRAYSGVPPRPDGVIELVHDGAVIGHSVTAGGATTTIDLRTGAVERAADRTHIARFAELPAGVKDLEIWLPHNERTELVELRSNAPVEPVASALPVWMHHGSSISQGSNATHPTGIWPAVAARLAEVQLVNLGFGGSALLDAFVARSIRDAPADAISLELGINLVNTDLMRLRAFGPAVHGFLDTIREGHPTTPLVVISPLSCPIHERTPGPGAFDPDALKQGIVRFRATGDPTETAGGKLTLEVIRMELERIVAERAASDPHLHLLDGQELYGVEDAQEHPLPDALHPDAETHQIIGERFAALAAARALGPFHAATDQAHHD